MKRKEKEEQIRKEEEKRQKEKIAAQEKKVVAKLVSEFNKRLGYIKNAFANSTYESAKNQFQLFDKNNDGTLSLKEFITAMNDLRIKVNPNELLYLYEFID